MDVDELARAVQGPVLRAQDEGFASEVAGYNSAAAHPGGIAVGATSASDVCHAVRFAAESGRPVAVLATGHGGVTTSDAVIVTTRRMTGCAVDPQSRTATVQAGIRWHQVITAAAPHGLAPLNGSSPDSGVMGYTLGGGLPMMGRTFGFAADHVRRIEVVTADGQVRTCDPTSEPDLFWALLGGRGGFGVVTEMEFDLMPVARLYGGALIFAGTDAAAVLHAYQRWCPDLPDEVTTALALLRLPDVPAFPPPVRGTSTVHLYVVSTLSAQEGERLLTPMRAAAPALIDTMRDLPYREVGSITNDPSEPASLWDDSCVLREFTPDTVDTLLRVAGPEVDVPITVIQLRQLGGAFSRPPRQPTAVDRDGAFALGVIAAYESGSGEVVPATVGRLLRELRPWSTGRVALSFSGSIRRPEEIGRAWSEQTYAKLLKVKRRYDPDNVFRAGFAILPGEPQP